ncbi:MAG: hypothetical protein R3272_04110 [Candidatus Promineifilaceae bacterium]|nr:hypothetical protein [Candidatus Promineifilaceae bacterium]
MLEEDTADQLAPDPTLHCHLHQVTLGKSAVGVDSQGGRDVLPGDERIARGAEAEGPAGGLTDRTRGALDGGAQRRRVA